MNAVGYLHNSTSDIKFSKGTLIHSLDKLWDVEEYDNCEVEIYTHALFQVVEPCGREN